MQFTHIYSYRNIFACVNAKGITRVVIVTVPIRSFRDVKSPANIIKQTTAVIKVCCSS